MDKPILNRYWSTFLENYSGSPTLWLEGYNLNNIRQESSKLSYLNHKARIKINLLNNLKKYTKQKKIDLENLMVSAWGLLLNRYSGSDDILFGYIKTIKEIQKTPILPVRCLVNENLSLDDYLLSLQNQIKKNLIQISNKTIETIIENKFINYLISFDHDHFIKKYNFNADLFPLILNIKHKNQIEVFYHSNKYSKESIQDFIIHYLYLLEQIMESDNQLVIQIPLITPSERKLFTHKNSKMLTKPIIYQTSDCVHARIKKISSSNSKKIAITHSSFSVSYQQLEDRSNQIVNLLLKHQVKPGDAVAVMMDRTPALIVAMIAIFKTGAMYVPIDPKYPEERIQYLLSDCDAKIILTNYPNKIPDQFKDRLQVLDDNYALLNSINTKLSNIETNPENIAYIIYTSGTTGQPKGVMIKHSSLINLTQWYKKIFTLTTSDRASQFASQSFDAFFCEVIPTLSVGASIHMVDDDIKLTPTHLIPWLQENKITIFDVTSAYAQILFNAPWPKTTTLRIFKLGGESLPRYPSQRFDFDIWNIYGPTETTVESTYMRIYKANQSIKKHHEHCSPPIGKPIQNSEMYIVDNHMQLVPSGVAGELLIGGAVLAEGYLNRHELTRKKFIRNIFNDHSLPYKLYKTGDLVRWLEDGNIEFIGRIDHQVKIRGYRIELSEIETAISQYPDVSEAVVLAKQILNGYKSLIAYLVPNLDKIRIPFQERCLFTTNEKEFIEVITEDFSKEGLALTGLSQPYQPGLTVKVNVKLPGMSLGQWFTGKIIWQIDQRAGVQFSNDATQNLTVKKSVEYYLATNNLTETLQSAAAKRSLRNALKKKLPDYMIPSVYCVLPELPLTINAKVDVAALPPPQEFDRLLERNYVAPRNETEEKIAMIWAKLLNLKQVSITDNFFNLGGNSLLVSQLSIKLLETFNLAIPAKILFNLPFIPVLAEYIDSRGKHYTVNSSVQNEILQDAQLSESLKPFKQTSANLSNPKGILLSGAGGFLGLYLLRDLLKETDAKIYCLIRKGNFESAAKRLISNVNYYHLSQDITLANRRIVIVTSDIAFDKFGISAEQYNSMADNIDVIYHCGAQVNTMAAYTSLRGSNVQGTIEMLKFAMSKFDKPIHYISTLSAANKLNKHGEYSEELPSVTPENLSGGYAISKWVSERLLAQAQHRGLPTTIFRSGYIFGQSDTGITNTNDSLLLLMKGCIQLGFAPDWHETIAVLPVDFVSSAIIKITLATHHRSNVYHLDHPQGIMWTDLVSWLNDYGYNVKLCSHKEWQHKLMDINESNALFPFLPHYLSLESEPNTPQTCVDHATEVLTKLKMPYPDINDELLSRYVEYLCEIEFFPMPLTRSTKSFVQN